MTTIKLVANDENLTAIEKPMVTSGDVKSVLVQITFTDEWFNLGKTVVFFTDKNDTAYETVISSGGFAEVPFEVLTKKCWLYIGVRGVDDAGKVKTSSLVKYQIHEGTPKANGETIEPTADVYAQILANYGKDESRITAEIEARQNADAEERSARELADQQEAENRMSAITAEANARKQADSDNKIELKNLIDIERKRIDTLSTLQEGSTTADAELMDIRLKADGTRAASAGEAVREQIKEVNDTLKELGSLLDAINGEVV